MYLPDPRVRLSGLTLPRTARISLTATFLALLLGAGSYGFFFHDNSRPIPGLSEEAFPLIEPTIRFGLAIDTLSLRVDTIQNGQTLSDLLTLGGVATEKLHSLSLRADSVMDLRALRAGKIWRLIDDLDTEGPDFFVYQPSVYEYVRLDLQSGDQTSRVELPVTTQIHTAGGVIESSLWNAMVGNGHSFELTDKMEDALQWSVDFYHVQPGESFKLVYDKDYVEDKEAAIGPVRAAFYHTASKDFYAFYFASEDGEHKGYYDKTGHPMKSTFLKAPIRYGRISSRYNLRRFHPILKRTRPHYGTDYAAPYGTPIMAVGNGVVVEAGRRGGNGNFVKIRHDKQFTTQYLHMQRFAKGIHPGVHVSQGEVIGYVGSTGLATGPHVCFRFWQNGRQVDHTKLEFPPAEPLPDSLMPAFSVLRDQYLVQLEQVELPQRDTTTLSTAPAP